jgi:hypothetical protein
MFDLQVQMFVSLVYKFKKFYNFDSMIVLNANVSFITLQVNIIRPGLEYKTLCDKLCLAVIS